MTGRVILGVMAFVVAVAAGRMFAEPISLMNELWGFDSSLRADWMFGTVAALLMMVPLIGAAGKPTSLSLKKNRERRAELQRLRGEDLEVPPMRGADGPARETEIVARCSVCLMEVPLDSVDLEDPKCPHCRGGYLRIGPRAGQ